MTTFGALVYHYLAREDEFKRIWGNTRESFCSHVDYLLARGGLVGIEELRSLALRPRSQNVLISFDDGLKEHATYFGPYLASRGIRALFNVPTCIFEDEPVPAHVIHFIGAFYGVRRLSALSIAACDRLCPEYRHFFREMDGAKDVFVLLSTLKDVFKKRLPHAIAGRILRSLYEKELYHRWPDFMERIYLSRDDVRALRRQGHTVGSHSHSHVVMRNVDRGLVRNELVKSKHILEDILQDKVDVFSYPYGQPDEILATSEDFKAAGYAFACTTAAPPSPVFDPFSLARYSTYSADTPAELEARMFWYEMSSSGV